MVFVMIREEKVVNTVTVDVCDGWSSVFGGFYGGDVGGGGDVGEEWGFLGEGFWEG